MRSMRFAYYGNCRRGPCAPTLTYMVFKFNPFGADHVRGRVLHVNGVKEDVLGTYCAGANKVIVSWANRKDE